MALPHASYEVAASKQPAVKGSGIPPFVVRVQYPQLCVPVSETKLDSLLTDIRQVECARKLVCEYCHIIYMCLASYRYLPALHVSLLPYVYSSLYDSIYSRIDQLYQFVLSTRTLFSSNVYIHIHTSQFSPYSNIRNHNHCISSPLLYNKNLLLCHIRNTLHSGLAAT